MRKLIKGVKLENVRLSYDSVNETIFIEGEAVVGNNDYTVHKAFSQAISPSMQEYTKLRGLIAMASNQSKSDNPPIDAGPEIAVLDYRPVGTDEIERSENESRVRRQITREWNTDPGDKSLLIEKPSKASDDVFITPLGFSGKSIHAVNLFGDQVNRNIFISGRTGSGKSVIADNIVRGVIHHRSNPAQTKIISFDPTGSNSHHKPGHGVTTIEDPLAFLMELRKILEAYYKTPAGELREFLVVIEDSDLFREPFDSLAAPVPGGNERTWKAVRAEILTLILDLSQIRTGNRNVRTCFVFTAQQVFSSDAGILSTCQAIVHLHTPSNATTRILFGKSGFKREEADYEPVGKGMGLIKKMQPKASVYEKSTTEGTPILFKPFLPVGIRTVTG